MVFVLLVFVTFENLLMLLPHFSLIFIDDRVEFYFVDFVFVTLLRVSCLEALSYKQIYIRNFHNAERFPC